MLNYKQAKALFASKRYAFFTGQYNLNIFGIRNRSNNSVYFDDWLYVVYQCDGVDKVFVCECTLNPGTYWLQNLMDKGGAAIIKEGQYRGVFKLGTYLNKPALLQVGLFTIYRDGNRDNVLDMDNKQTTGNYGLFMHEHHQPIEDALVIGKSSAGCVVPKRNADFYRVIELCEKQIPIWGNSYTFTVFTENDVLLLN